MHPIAYVSERGKYLSCGPEISSNGDVYPLVARQRRELLQFRAHPVRQTRVELVEAPGVLVREQLGDAPGLHLHATEVGENGEKFGS